MIMLPEYSVENKKVLLIGASRGVGKGIARVMAEAGANIGIAGLTAGNAEKAAEDIRKAGGNATSFVTDATKQEDMDILAPLVLKTLGGLDALINCVGDHISSPVVTLPDKDETGMTQADWQKIVDLNLTEAFLGCRAFGSHFIQQGYGSIINISSFASVKAAKLRSAYDAAKAGLDQFTRSLALEWAPFNIRVNALAPGLFPDPEQLTEEQLQARSERAKREVPLGRVGLLREAGLLAVYLTSDASSYVTGQSFAIDGGLNIA